MEALLNRITFDEAVLNGKPCIRGQRISLQTVLEFLSAGNSKEEILDQYPSLEAADIDACLRFAAEMMKHEYSVVKIA